MGSYPAADYRSDSEQARGMALEFIRQYGDRAEAEARREVEAARSGQRAAWWSDVVAHVSAFRLEHPDIGEARAAARRALFLRRGG